MASVTVELRPGDVGEHTQVRVTLTITEALSAWELVDLCAALEAWPGAGKARVVWSAGSELDWLGEWTRAAVETAAHAAVEVHQDERAERVW